ncbi:MAG TPA: cytochrome C [Gammaproteobacteria bacterium]|nr:cytochrome C [Gammaproteobacteria bacterium]
MLSNQSVGVSYQSASSPTDPAGAGSINTTSQNKSGIFKTNFWEQLKGKTLAGGGYGALYPPGVFDSFEPLPADKGIPVPDPALLPALAAGQQSMPGFNNPFKANTPQGFDRFDADFHFFADFPFGRVIQGVDWFAADGIPLFPVDDSGASNAYPLMKVSATDKTSGKVLTSTDVVLPVSSEADCQNCHADPGDAGNGIASTFAGTAFSVIRAANAPEPEKLLNAAKINILRLHDAKHGAKYTSSIDGKPAVCDAAANPADPDCLANQVPVQCSQCHYSPALDLAQVGPINDTKQGIKGRQQTRHISMSRAMHAFHGRQKDGNGKQLFPDMPAPTSAARSSGPAVNDFELGVLEDTCYQCHPGKNTQCLRGAMFSGGVVCQDCHGNMEQVGNDFTGKLASGGGLDLTKRVPWASEPKCQSCHTGDASQSNHPAGAIVAKDGIRLLQAYATGDATATPFTSPASRFAENQGLYRLSGSKDGTGKGHEGIMCEGCHGSTHAIWPNPNPNANDNIAASQLQGHTGTIIECNTCHEAGSLGVTLDGPHGMHPVGGTRFADGGHEDLAEDKPGACRSCHGNNGQGTVLSEVAADRSFVIEECEGGTLCSGGKAKNFQVTLAKGTKVTCNLCHENKL